jgi:hypothetical protein
VPAEYLPGSFFAMRDDVAERFRRKRWMRHDDHRRPGDQPDRRKILGKVVAGIGTEADAGQQHGDGVAVRRRLGGVAGADHAAGAAAILDHDLLAERVRKLLPDDAAHRVDAAAGRIGHDQRDRSGRIILRRRRSRHQGSSAAASAVVATIRKTARRIMFFPAASL